MTQQEIKSEHHRLVKVIEDAGKAIDKLRKTCKHPDKHLRYMHAINITGDYYFCPDCKVLIPIPF
jgi:hypothetical protein